MRAHQLLADLADCLCRTIDESSVPNTCFCGVITGDSVVMDFAGCTDGENQGMAWVRMTLLYPASGVNAPNEQINNCGSSIGMDLEIGMARPVTIVDELGNPPTSDDYLQASKLVNEDALVMLRALQCCDSLGNLDYIVGAYTPSGPLGGVLIGTWPVAVILD